MDWKIPHSKLAEALASKFGVALKPIVKTEIDNWAKEIFKLVQTGSLTSSNWSNELHQLYVFCSNNRTDKTKPFDQSCQFSQFMEQWKNSLSKKDLPKITILARTPLDAKSQTKETKVQESLSDRLMANLNLREACRDDLKKEEIELKTLIASGMSYDKVLALVKDFCRRNVNDNGFYDHKGMLHPITLEWYISVSAPIVKAVHNRVSLSPTKEQTKPNKPEPRPKTPIPIESPTGSRVNIPLKIDSKPVFDDAHEITMLLREIDMVIWEDQESVSTM